MAIIEATARESLDLVGDGEKEVLIKSLLSGALSMAQFVEVMSLEGRVFSTHDGEATATITFGAGTILETEPDLSILVPDGVTIVPVEIVIVMEEYGSAGIFEFMAQIGQGSDATLGSGTDGNIWNVNLDHPRASACQSEFAVASGGAVAPSVNVIEFWRGCENGIIHTATGDDDSAWHPVNYTWRAKDAGWYPILNGKGALQVFATSQAGKGFIQCRFLEFPSEWLS